MTYVKIKNNEVVSYPYPTSTLRKDNPNVSFPKELSTELLNSYGVYEVLTEDTPSINNRTQKALIADIPVLIGSNWVLQYTVSEKTSEEVSQYDADIAEVKRDQRNTLLAETDFHALSDVTMSAEMTTYRQALRDITSHANWPHLEDADWPTKP